MPQKNRTVTGVLGGFLGLVSLSVAAGVLVTATITPAIAVSGAAASQAIDLFDGLHDYLKVDAPMEPTTIYAINSRGEEVELASFFDQNRVPITFDQLTPMVIDAILSSEDKNFFEHGGINLGATAKAMVDYARGTSTRGASTITQQFVKNVLVQQCEQTVLPTDEEYFEKVNECWTTYTNAKGQEGILRKLQEMRYALQIDKDYSKNDILVGYLNIANYGGTVYGIEAAANYYFGKTLADLTLSEAATLAGIVQNPNTYRIDKEEGSTTDSAGNPANSAEDGYAEAKERRNYVLGRMLEDGKITQAEHDAARAEEIVPDIHEPSIGCGSAGANAYFCQYVKRVLETDPVFGETHAERQQNLRRGGMKVYTTLDTRLQSASVKVMKDRVPASRKGMRLGAAGLSLENSTGRILAMTQNTRFTERADQAKKAGYTGLVFAADRDHGGSIGFPVGSTYKLFTLLAWLEAGHSINELVDGTDQVFRTWYCHGQPNSNNTRIFNFAGQRGMVADIPTFTAESLNTGFLAMAVQLDVCEINELAERMGVKTGTGRSVTENSVLFDVLGSHNIAVMDMAAAYATVANNGIYCTPRAIDKIIGRDGEERELPKSSCTPVLSPEVAATAAYTLRAPLATGTAVNARTNDGVPQIGKSGTHERFQTTLISSSPKVTNAVWVGNISGKVSLYGKYHKGIQLAFLRHGLIRTMQLTANRLYGGGSFPAPDKHLTRKVYAEIPEVIGMNVDEATEALKDAGFVVKVEKKATDSPLPAGLIGKQTPGAGKAIKGTQVRIWLSNGQGQEIPNVQGMNPGAAVALIQSWGFTDVALGDCTVDALAPVAGEVTGTSPGTGVIQNIAKPVRVHYQRPVCP